MNAGLQKDDSAAVVILCLNLGILSVVFLVSLFLARHTFRYLKMNGEQAEISTKATFIILILSSLGVLVA